MPILTITEDERIRARGVLEVCGKADAPGLIWLARLHLDHAEKYEGDNRFELLVNAYDLASIAFHGQPSLAGPIHIEALDLLAAEYAKRGDTEMAEAARAEAAGLRAAA